MSATDTEPRGWGELAKPRADDPLASLYAAHAQGVGRLALLLTGDVEVAQDITQEAFVRVGGRLARLRDPERSVGYLYRTVQNLAKDHGRGLSRQRRLNDRLGSQPATAEAEHDDDLWVALMELPLRQRTALFLRYYLDLSEVEAAEALDLSSSAMKSLTHRAVAALKHHIEGAQR